MDPFEEPGLTLEGSLLSMEFHPTGRISKLWAYDPLLPEEGEEFQFILPPVSFAEEQSDDYLPGTILLGVRTGPDDPWVATRLSGAVPAFDMDDDDDKVIKLEYTFPFLDEISATGTFREVLLPYPQIIWDIELVNTSRTTIEIGEVGFPMAFNNFYEGFGWNDDQLERLWNSRVYVHKHIGGAMSWLLAQRMNAQAPNLLCFPGDGTEWEFFASVRGSLNTPFHWEGIPVVYAHSRATVEREEWPEWMNGHTSIVLEPGDRKTFQLRFTSIDTDRHDGIAQMMVLANRPAMRVFPSAVVPVGVSVGIEVAGVPLRSVQASEPVSLEVDSDEESSLIFIRNEQPGPVRITLFTEHGPGYAHLMFTPKIRDLILARANYIATRQVIRDESSPLNHAIVLANITEGVAISTPEEYLESSGLESSLADALYLAEKNTIYPDRSQIKVVDDYIEKFLLQRVQNPATGAVASSLNEGAMMGEYFGRPLGYPHVMNLHHSMYRVARTYGETVHPPETYLQRAWQTAMAMFRYGWRHYVRTVGLLGYARIYDLIDDLQADGMEDEAATLLEAVQAKAEELTSMRAPYAGETVLDTSGMEEVFAAAKFLSDDAHLERTVRCAFAARSLAPSWWWAGSDKRCWDGADSSPIKALTDRGEAALAHTTIPNSLIFLGLMDRDYFNVPESYMRMAFAGLIGPWALVSPDGGASMCFVPDLASRHAGFNSFTGASGVGYYHYLRGSASLVLPNRNESYATIGCHFDSDNGVYKVVPWDGVGRRVILRQIGVSFQLDFGCFKSITLHHDKRTFVAEIENPSDKVVEATLMIEGLWGTVVTVEQTDIPSVDGKTIAVIGLPEGRITTIVGKVK
ncbi:MAG: hypothetical protein KF812_12260 [Fimbriimonadaceae bacterium]|nr:hypothetical protein [Fimbriimonadaceae bacterium]